MNGRGTARRGLKAEGRGWGVGEVKGRYMTLPLFLRVVVEWLHIVVGIAWVGSHITFDFAILPGLLRRPTAEAKAANETIVAAAQPLFMSGMLVIVLGIVRGMLLGPITSFDFLFSTAYGITWLTALILTLGVGTWSGLWYGRLLGPVWEGDHVRKGALRRIRTGTAITLTGFGVVLVCMVLMGVGL
jgi:uncharacterized membrane protein